MKTKVIGIKNLKNAEKQFDIEKVLSINSDCVLGYDGAYKHENGTMIKVNDKSEAELCVYYNMETGDMVEIPYKYVEVFEQANHIFGLDSVPVSLKTSQSTKQKSVKKRAKVITRTNCSNR